MSDMRRAPDRFAIGCNYWASHAGVRMWSDWREATVSQDLDRLAGLGLTTLRVFPIWSEFQPLLLLRTYRNAPKEYHVNDRVVNPPDAGIDPAMLDLFRRLADIAAERHLKLIVGLITGWMSGQMFIPPALAHLNPLVDGESIAWQIRYVRAFVEAMRTHPAIIGWDLGNECNCMGQATRSQLWTWTHAIASAIRLADPSRPVISGMHGLSIDPRADSATIYDQAELTDVLTTHPYPAFTPGCDLDPLPTIRPALHAAAESCLYADVGNCPCMVEEIGTLSDEYADEQSAADYVRMSLYSAWAHNTSGFLWWCAFDQSHLPFPPYDWSAGERELGLFRTDGTTKPVAGVLREFAAMLDRMPVNVLPPRMCEGICILTEGQDQWRIGYSAFVLAKQAGFDVRFAYAERSVPEAPLYLLPCVRGLTPVPRRQWLGLLERVRAGATLYISYDGGVLSGLRGAAGIEVVHRRQASTPITFQLPAARPARASVAASTRVLLRPAGARVLSSDENEDPALTEHSLGRGKVIFAAAPLEQHLAETSAAFAPDAPPYWSIYRHLARSLGSRFDRALIHADARMISTEHSMDHDAWRIAIAVNIGAGPERLPGVAPGWRREACDGSSGEEWLKAFHGAVLKLTRV